jgi:hypothetical protein
MKVKTLIHILQNLDPEASIGVLYRDLDGDRDRERGIHRICHGEHGDIKFTAGRIDVPYNSIIWDADYPDFMSSENRLTKNDWRKPYND